MAKYIQYENRRYKKLTFRIFPSTDFQQILSKLNNVSFSHSTLTPEQIIYAVLELINNSLRAHREKAHDLPIYLRFAVDSDGYEVYLQDWGGGFDITRLPYDLYEDTGRINIHDENFEQYRLEHNHQRFGLGLYLAKKTFTHFNIYFIDEDGLETTWETGKSAGTVIHLRTITPATRAASEEQHEKSAPR
jgi:anti-sigma regulatory factor (Ser/Thr protein kinase)